MVDAGSPEAVLAAAFEGRVFTSRQIASHALKALDDAGYDVVSRKAFVVDPTGENTDLWKGFTNG